MPLAELLARYRKVGLFLLFIYFYQFLFIYSGIHSNCDHVLSCRMLKLFITLLNLNVLAQVRMI